MASLGEFDFPAFVLERASRRPGAVLGNDHGYAYVSDRNTRATFERLRPVELAVAAAVRTFKNVGKAELLGHAVEDWPRASSRACMPWSSAARRLWLSRCPRCTWFRTRT